MQDNRPTGAARDTGEVGGKTRGADPTAGLGEDSPPKSGEKKRKKKEGGVEILSHLPFAEDVVGR